MTRRAPIRYGVFLTIGEGRASAPSLLHIVGSVEAAQALQRKLSAEERIRAMKRELNFQKPTPRRIYTVRKLTLGNELVLHHNVSCPTALGEGLATLRRDLAKGKPLEIDKRKRPLR